MKLCYHFIRYGDKMWVFDIPLFDSVISYFYTQIFISYLFSSGTDVNQHYPLEPFLFSLENVPQKDRESPTCWRNFGFFLTYMFQTKIIQS